MHDGQYSSFSDGRRSQQATKLVDLYDKARNEFIRKVYTILTIQILITIFFVLLSMNSISFFMFQVNNIAIFYIALVVCAVIQLYMFCCNGGQTSPSNYICVGIFTLSEAYIISFFSSITGKESGNYVVLLAGIYTLAIVVALTIYACTTDTDFTTSIGIVLVLTVCLMILGITSMIVDSPFMTNLYCCFGVLVFGVYLVIDTQLIMGGHTNSLAIDQCFLAAMLIYTDIIQIFLFILRILGNK